MALFKSIATVGGFTMLSRVFGFARDILVANFLGAGAIADAFVVAFRFPNLFRRLFAEGAFSAAFVPIFTGMLEQEGRARARQFANEAFSVLAILLLVLVIVMELAMPWAMYGLAPGFEDVPGKMQMATEMSRIAFPYLFFISLVSLQSGVLNSLDRFAAAAAAPVLLNITLIVALLGFANLSDLPVKTSGHALSWGVFAAGIIQFLWLVYHCRKQGMPVWFVRPRLSSKVRLLGARILPVVFGASLYQINLLIGTILASFVSDGAVSYLYYADRVTQLPLGVVGVAVGTALLPLLSRQLKANNVADAMNSQNRGVEFALLLTLPAATALIVIAQPIVMVLFERGAFDAAASAATADALWAFATGLPAYVLIKALTPGFFAREDTRTPVRIAMVAMTVNIVLNLILMQVYGHVGIALAASLSAWLNAIALGVVLYRRGFLQLDARLMSRLPKTMWACSAMALFLALAQQNLAEMLAGDMQTRALALGLMIGGGAFVFFTLAHISGAARLNDLRGLYRGKAS